MPGIRTTRTTRTTRSSALAALAVPALLLSACGEASEDTAAPALTAAQTSTQPLDADVLLTNADTVYSDGADWFRLGTGDEDLDGHGDLAHPCLGGPGGGLAGTGATDVIRADFELRNTAAPKADIAGDQLTQLVGQYDDAADAAAAYARVVDLVTACVERPDAISDFRTIGERPLGVPGAEALILDAHFGPLPAGFGDTRDAAYIMETGIGLQDDTVTVLTSIIVGQDYNFLPEDGGTPVEQMLPVALERLG